MEKKELSVVFLMWIPYGIGYFRSFLNSYIKYPSGTEHQLVIVFNGYQTTDDLLPYHDILASEGVNYLSLELQKGQDIFAYKWSAEQLSSKYILFFNTYSQILNFNWGRYYLTAISTENVGCVGATGSWQSRSSYGVQRVKWIFSTKEKIIKNIPYYTKKVVTISGHSVMLPPRLALLAAFLKSLKDIFSFPFFPNPHLRTNAFIVDRAFWLTLDFNPLQTKKDAYLMESGYNSFTRQILKKQKKVFVMDKFGAVFEPTYWNSSKTLWAYNQENLLVSDNFTTLYQSQDDLNRIPMAKFLWGFK